jgi:hypothetical protein
MPEVGENKIQTDQRGNIREEKNGEMETESPLKLRSVLQVAWEVGGWVSEWDGSWRPD